MFRWKGIIVIAVIILIVVTISLLLTDRWLEGQLEDIGSSIVGAKVEIDDLDISLFGMQIRWERLQVTHPQYTMKNMIETDTCNVDLEFWPLLSKKIVVEDFRMRGIKTFTDRATDGALPKEEREEQAGFIAETITKLSRQVEASGTETFTDFKQKVNVDSIIKILDLRSIGRIDSLQKALVQNYDSWDKKLAELTVQQDIKKIEADLKSLDVKKIDNVQELQKALTTANNIKKDVEKLNEEFKTTKTNFVGDFEQAKNSLKQVDDWIKADYARARSLAKLPDLSAQNIGMMIFGQQAVERFNTYLGYAGMARRYAAKFKSDKPEKVKPPRLKGQDIYFYNLYARPDFWIKSISLSGQTNDQLKLNGDVLNIVSNQKQIQQPTEIRLSGARQDGARLAFSGLLDYRTEQPLENFELDFSGFSMANTRLSESKLLPTAIKSGRGNVKTTLKLEGESIDGKIQFVGQQLLFDFKEQTPSKNILERMIRDIVQNITLVDFSARLRGHKNDLTFSVSSNLDEVFVKNLRASVSKEIEAAKKQIEERIDKEVSKYRAQLEKVVKEKEAQLTAEIEKYQAMVDEKVQEVEARKKEIEDKIEAEKKKLEKSAKDKLKKLIK